MKTLSILMITALLLSGCWISSEKKTTSSKDLGVEVVSTPSSTGSVPVMTQDGTPVTGSGHFYENTQK